jgi:HSP20 family molecular chaperone IbpA
MKSTILPTPNSLERPGEPHPAAETFRQPVYDCRQKRDAVQITVYVPGVEATGVEIEGHGADLTVTARKSHFVRVNFPALHLEAAQRDYQLRLRLGSGFDYPSMAATIAQGVLTITVPKRARAEPAHRLRRVA